jgi:hypothetical protein
VSMVGQEPSLAWVGRVDQRVVVGLRARLAVVVAVLHHHSRRRQEILHSAPVLQVVVEQVGLAHMVAHKHFQELDDPDPHDDDFRGVRNGLQRPAERMELREAHQKQHRPRLSEKI